MGLDHGPRVRAQTPLTDITGIASALGAAEAVVAEMAASPDAGLLDLGVRYHDTLDRQQACLVWGEMTGVDGYATPEVRQQESLLKAIGDERFAVGSRIADIPARTPHGLAVKAMVLNAAIADGGFDFSGWEGDYGKRLIGGIADDINALAGRYDTASKPTRFVSLHGLMTGESGNG